MDIRTFILQCQGLVIPEVGVGADLGLMFAEGVLIAPRLLPEVAIKILKINNLVES